MSEAPREKPLPVDRPLARARWPARWLFHLAFGLLLPLSWLWALLALHFFSGWTVAGRRLAVGLWIAATATILAYAPGFGLKAGLLLTGIAFIRLLWGIHRPLDERNWAVDQSRLPGIRFDADGSRVEIENVRDARPEPEGTLAYSWHRETINLSDVRSVDYILVPFAAWRGIAHVFLSFGFAEGRHLAVSIEARREKSERYSPLRGIFRSYEVCHVIGEERDLLGSRANLKGHAVYLYPLLVPAETARVLFERILREAARVADHPEFYNTLTNTCTRAIAVPANTLRDEPINLLDPRIIFPGYSDLLLRELGFVDSSLPLDEARARALINARAAWHDDPVAWSRQIRTP